MGGGIPIKKTKWKLDDYEIWLIFNALAEWRNKLKSEGKCSDAIDKLILKICK